MLKNKMLKKKMRHKLINTFLLYLKKATMLIQKQLTKVTMMNNTFQLWVFYAHLPTWQTRAEVQINHHLNGHACLVFRWRVTKDIMMKPPHSFSTSIFNKNHWKLSFNLMYQHLKPYEYNFTPSYRKKWIARNKEIEHVYNNWDNSYKELPHYLLALKKCVPGMLVEMETLPIYTNDDTLVEGKHIFHQIFWAFQPCIKGFSYCKPILQIDGTWLYGKYKGTLLMAVPQDGNINIFKVSFAPVEGESVEGWGSFYKTWEGMLLLNLTIFWF